MNESELVLVHAWALGVRWGRIEDVGEGETSLLLGYDRYAKTA